MAKDINQKRGPTVGNAGNAGNIGTISVSRTGNTVALTVTPDPAITPVTARFARIGLKA